jgi:hypothetical protein
MNLWKPRTESAGESNSAPMRVTVGIHERSGGMNKKVRPYLKELKRSPDLSL